MDDHAPAEELPTLYRSVLEAVARLERVGERSAAFRIRRDAIKAYSTNWNEAGRRRLERLSRDAQRVLENHPRAAAAGSLAAGSEPA